MLFTHGGKEMMVSLDTEIVGNFNDGLSFSIFVLCVTVVCFASVIASIRE